MRYKVTTPSATEPLTLAEAKEHLRTITDDEDAQIEAWISVAREVVETVTRRALVTQTVTLKLDKWPCNRRIVLPLPPLLAVSAVQYVDGNGNTQTLSTSLYQVVNSGEPAYIVPAYNVTWPEVRAQPDSITITYTAGYGDADDVPARAKHAMKLLLSHMDQNREAVNVGNLVTEMPFGVKALLGSLDFGSYA
jgi:uncharacterized phiE125 gp8 family phage protein